MSLLGSSTFTWRTLRRTSAGALALAVATLGLASAAPAETVIKFATTMPNGSVMMKAVYQPWIDALNEAGKGEFVVVPQEPPFAVTTNVWDRVVSGVADMGFAILPNTGVPFPRSTVSMLPGLVDNDTEAGSIAFWRLYERGLLADEFDSVKIMNIVALPPAVLVSKEPITSLDQLAGKKVRVLDKISADAVEALGGSSIAIPFSDTYQALSSGVVDAILANGTTLLYYKFGELMTKQVNNVYFGMLPSVIFMNKAFYESLSPKAKEIVDTFVGEESSRQIGAAYTKFESENYATLGSQNSEYTFIELPREERDRWHEAIEPIVSDWVSATPDGQALVDAFKEEYAKAKQ